MKKLIVGLLGLLLTGSAFGEVWPFIENHQQAIIDVSKVDTQVSVFCNFYASTTNGALGYVDGTNIFPDPRRSFGVNTSRWEGSEVFRFKAYKPHGVLMLHNRTPDKSQGGWEVKLYYHCYRLVT